jgi:hypothetical protein
MYNLKSWRNQLILFTSMKMSHLILHMSLYLISGIMLCNGQNIIPKKNLQYSFLLESGLSFQNFKPNVNSFQSSGFSYSPETNPFSGTGTTLTLPSLKTPNGAIFCRMENKLRDTFKVWIKVHAVHE